MCALVCAILEKTLLMWFMIIPYDTKFWREKILANLANCKRFAKIFSFENYKLEAMQHTYV